MHPLKKFSILILLIIKIFNISSSHISNEEDSSLKNTFKSRIFGKIFEKVEKRFIKKPKKGSKQDPKKETKESKQDPKKETKGLKKPGQITNQLKFSQSIHFKNNLKKIPLGFKIVYFFLCGSFIVYVGYQLKGLVLYWKNFESGTSNTTNTGFTGNELDQNNSREPTYTPETIPEDTQNSRTSYPNQPSNNANPPFNNPNQPSNNANPPSNNPKQKPKPSVPPQVIQSSVPIELDDLIKAVDNLISEQGYNNDVNEYSLELLKEIFQMEKHMEDKQQSNSTIAVYLQTVLDQCGLLYFMSSNQYELSNLVDGDKINLLLSFRLNEIYKKQSNKSISEKILSPIMKENQLQIIKDFYTLQRELYDNIISSWNPETIKDINLSRKNIRMINFVTNVNQDIINQIIDKISKEESWARDTNISKKCITFFADQLDILDDNEKKMAFTFPQYTDQDFKEEKDLKEAKDLKEKFLKEKKHRYLTRVVVFLYQMFFNFETIFSKKTIIVDSELDEVTEQIIEFDKIKKDIYYNYLEFILKSNIINDSLVQEVIKETHHMSLKNKDIKALNSTKFYAGFDPKTIEREQWPPFENRIAELTLALETESDNVYYNKFKTLLNTMERLLKYESLQIET